jgi:hypothetical protein
MARMSQIAIAFIPTFPRQVGWDTPRVLTSSNSKSYPATSKDYLEEEETLEEIYDCTGEDLLFELMTGRIARLRIEMDVDSGLLAGWTAAALGVALAPSGGANNVLLVTITATGGTFKLTVFHNYATYTTAALAYNASTATVQAALEALPNVGTGNVAVGGSVGAYTVTFQADLANQEIGTLGLTANGQALTGTSAGAVVSETTPATGPSHVMTRLATYALPLMSFYVGFRGSSVPPKIFKNVGVNVLRVTSRSRQPVRATVELVGSADLQDASGFVMPACQDITAIRFGDCGLTLNGVDYMALNIMREFEFSYANNIPTDEFAFTGQGLDITRVERADRRPSGISIGIIGEPNDARDLLAKAHTIMPGVLRIGPAGNDVTVNVPQGAYKRDRPLVRPEGNPPEAVLRHILQPRKVSVDANTPLNVVAHVPQSVAYLLNT